MRSEEKVGFVPTMGALHEGHLSLIRLAKRECDRVVVSVFVNPLQFAPGEDFERYPRPEQADQRLLEREGVEVWRPTVDELYPEGLMRVHPLNPPETLTRVLCGKDRPDHFAGVATVVDRLLSLLNPSFLYLGEKDHQQVRVIEWLLRERHPRVHLRVGKTVRDTDGLALSSRNRYLSLEERGLARAIPLALDRVRSAYDAGERDVESLVEVGEAVLRRAHLEPIYFEIRQAETLNPLDHFRDGVPAVVAVAVRVGSTRLIDHCLLG